MVAGIAHTLAMCALTKTAEKHQIEEEKIPIYINDRTNILMQWDAQEMTECIYKLDGVGPVDNRPSRV